MLAADFVALSLEQQTPYELTLFARDPKRSQDAIARRTTSPIPECRPLEAFSGREWDIIINFVGVGDPARAVAMGADILRITRLWDDRVLEYLDTHPHCRYLFLSSGAAFGEIGPDPIGPGAKACFDINELKPHAFYGISKFYSEAVHRAWADRSIIDIRVFNYISKFADLSHRFLVNEIIAAVRDGRVLSVEPNDMWRDYLSTEDFAALIAACIEAPVGYNSTIDAYSRAPISKMEMLEMFHREFGLVFDISGGGINATGAKSSYYSCNRQAEALGYQPQASSRETLTKVTQQILSGGTA